MAGQGLPTVTQEAVFEQYVDIGKSSGDSETFIRIYLKPNNGTGVTSYFADEDGDGLIDGVGGAPHPQGQLHYFNIRFIKSRSNNFDIDDDLDSKNYTGDTRTLLVSFEGGKNKHTYLDLKSKINDYWLDNFSEYFFKLEAVCFGPNRTGLVPYRDVDNGDPMFANDFKIETHEITEASTVVDPSYYTVSTDDVEEGLLEPPYYYSVEDPDGISATLADLQKDICIKEPVEDEFGSFSNPDLKRICPTCIPNPSHIPLTWYKEEKVWLNEKTCNYTYRVKTDVNYYSLLETDQKGRFIRGGIRAILISLNKQIIDQDICWSPPENSSEECEPRIPQSVIDQYVEIYETPAGQFDRTTFTVYRLNPSIYDTYQIRNPIALELFARASSIAPISYDAPGVISQNSKAYIKVTIPANLINLIPEDLLAEESEDAQEDLQDVEEVILKGPTIKRTSSTSCKSS